MSTLKNEQIREERARWQASFTDEDKLAIFCKQSFQTKEDVIADIQIEIHDLENDIKEVAGAKSRYLSTKREMLIRFISKIQKTILFNALEPWWAYQYVVCSRGIFLQLIHAGSKVLVRSEDEVFYIPDTTFNVVELPAKTMSIEEYANYSGKTQASIRQALRRGKFRSAYKVGQEWRISELCEPDLSRGYSEVRYQWKTELTDIPDEFSYLREPTFIDITQDAEDKQRFVLYVHSQHMHDNPYHTLGKTEMEWLEHYLIANPFVVYLDDEKKYDKRRKKDEK